MKVSTKTAKAFNLERQFKFAQAAALTAVALEAQKEVIDEIKSERYFTVRGKWFEPGNRFGIKVKTASFRAETIASQVFTQADWLKKQKEGGEFRPDSGHAVLVPTEFGRRGKRDTVIPASVRRSMRKENKTFVLKTKFGPVVYTRFKSKRKVKGRNVTGLVPLFGLEEAVSIKPVDLFHPTVQRVVKARLKPLYNEKLQAALESAFTDKAEYNRAKSNKYAKGRSRQ